MHWYERFKRTEGLMTPADGALLYALATSAVLDTGCKHVVELGVYRGRSACALGAACRDTGATLFGYDIWGTVPSTQKSGSEEMATKALALADLTDCVRILTGDSADAGRSWAYGRVAMVFIDASHTYEAASADIVAWSKHIPPGGILALHDVNCPAVQKAIDDNVPKSEFRHIGSIGVVGAYRRPMEGEK